jgi:SAM-dependent methyltransferase
VELTPISYEEIFKYSDIFNPISLQTLQAAGKLANFAPEKTLIDLGCGKGFPALFWASMFGVQVEGFDRSQTYVDYSNARAKLLNLSNLACFFRQDLKSFVSTKKYDVVASLGVGAEVFGGWFSAFKFFRSLLKDDGVILYSEPVWTSRPVKPEVLGALQCKEDVFLTVPEVRRQLLDLNLQELGFFVAPKEDWELYARPAIIALKEITKNKPDLAAEAQAFLSGFKMEHEAAGKDWEMVLWVLKPK